MGNNVKLVNNKKKIGNKSNWLKSQKQNMMEIK